MNISDGRLFARISAGLSVNSAAPYRSGMNAKIKRNFFIHGSIHAGVQRVGFHRSDHAAHSRQALSNGALLRLVLQQDARAAQEA